MKAILLRTVVLMVLHQALADPEDLSQPRPGVNQHFYPYGIPNGDTISPPTDDMEMDMNISISLHYGTFRANQISLDPNGFVIVIINNRQYSITFFNIDMLTERHPHISFMSARETTDPSILARASNDIQNEYGRGMDQFTATWAFVGTLHDANPYNAYYGANSVMTAQIVLATDGSLTFGIINYGEVIEFTTNGLYFSIPNGGRYSWTINSEAVEGERTILRLDTYPIPTHVMVENPSTSGPVVITPCEPGHYSATGNSPCTNCTLGQYQPNAGQQSCTNCPDGQSTEDTGSISQDQCFGESTVVGDPHFLITNPSDKEHFCFDVGGKEGDVLQLVRDTKLGLNVEGQLFEVTLNDLTQTYFSTIEITFGNHQIMFTRADIICDDDTVSWTSKDVNVFGSIVIRPVQQRDDTIMVEINGGDISLLVNRHLDKVGFFLGIFISNSDGLSNETDGILGQFVHHEFQILENNQSFYAHLRFPDRDPIVPVRQQLRFNPSHHNTVDCWLYEPKEGESHEILNF